MTTAPLLAAHIQHADLNRKVYDQIRAALLSGEMRAGQKLNLNALAEQLGVSRSPVHQALTRLATEGLIDVRSRRGYHVTPVTSKAVNEEYDVRLALELLAAERAVGRLDGKQLARLGVALDALLEVTAGGGAADLGAYVQTNQRFHRLQLELAGNDALLSTYGSLRVSLLMERLLAGLTFDRETTQLLDEQHIALHAAYVHGDLAAARRTIRAHVGTGRRLAVDAIEEAGGSR